MKQSHINGSSKNLCYNDSSKSNMEDKNMPFSEKLSKMRNDRGLTQQQMAAMIGVGIAQVRRYEKGNSSPTLEVIKNIAKTLGISADELIFDKGEGVPDTRIMDKKLLEQFEMVSKLKPHDKEAIMTIIDSMIIKNRLEQVMPGSSDAAWTNQMRKVVKEFRSNAKDYSEDEIDNLVDEAVQSVRSEENTGDKIGA
ncbi:MAG: RstR family transcriptional repressor [Pseudomonadota bacterium]